MSFMQRSLFAILGVASLLLALSFFATPPTYAATANQAISSDCPVYDYGSSSDATVRNFASPPLWSFEGSNAQYYQIANTTPKKLPASDSRPLRVRLNVTILCKY